MAMTTLTGSDAGLTAQGVVARYFRIWNDGDPRLVGDLLTSDWVDHAHPERRGVDDVARAITTARADTPGLRIYVDALLGDETLVTVNGRSQSETGMTSWVWIVRMEHGRMREMWTYPGN